MKHPRRSISGGGGGAGAWGEGQWEVTRARSSLAAAGTVHKRDLSLDDNATAFMKSAQAVCWWADFLINTLILVVRSRYPQSVCDTC